MTQASGFVFLTITSCCLLQVCVCKCKDKGLKGYKLIVNEWLFQGKEIKWGETRGSVEDFNFISYMFFMLFHFKKWAYVHVSLNNVLDYVKNAGCREYNSWKNTYVCIKKAAKTTMNIDSITPENLGIFAFNKSALFDFIFLFMSTHSSALKANEICNIKISSRAFFLITWHLPPIYIQPLNDFGVPCGPVCHQMTTFEGH